MCLSIFLYVLHFIVMGSHCKSSVYFGLMDIPRSCPVFDNLPMSQLSSLSTVYSTSGRLLG